MLKISCSVEVFSPLIKKDPLDSFHFTFFSARIISMAHLSGEIDLRHLRLAEAFASPVQQRQRPAAVPKDVAADRGEGHGQGHHGTRPWHGVVNSQPGKILGEIGLKLEKMMFKKIMKTKSWWLLIDVMFDLMDRCFYSCLGSTVDQFRDAVDAISSGSALHGSNLHQSLGARN